MAVHMNIYISEKNILDTSKFPSIAEDVDIQSETSSILSLDIHALNKVKYKRSQHTGLTGLSSDIKTELCFVIAPNNLLLLMIYLLLLIGLFMLGIQSEWNDEILPPINCVIEGLENSSWTLKQKINITSFRDSMYREGCKYYDYNYYNLGGLPYETAYEIVLGYTKQPNVILCKKYSFEKKIPEQTSFAADVIPNKVCLTFWKFDLACFNKVWQLPRMYYSLGSIVFLTPLGFLADVYGRKSVYVWSAVTLTVTSFAAPLSSNIIFFTIFYSTAGVSMRCSVILLTVIYSESFKHKQREFMTTFSASAFYLGIAVSLNRNFIVHWRLEMLACAIANLILLFGLIFLPESPIFLMVNRQYKSSWDTLRELGSREKRPYSRNLPYPENRINLQLKLLTQSYIHNRICLSIISYGIGLLIAIIFENISSKTMPQANLKNFQFLWLRIIAAIILSVLSTIYSKKAICCTTYVFLAVCFIGAHSTQSQAIEESVKVLAKTLTPLLWVIIVLYILDVFPTTHRCTALSLNSSIGSAMIELFLYYRHQLIAHLEHQTLATFYFSICMICAFVSLMGPRTYEELPNTKDDLINEYAPEEHSAYSNNS